MRLDLDEAGGGERFVASVLERYGAVDVLVNAAGRIDAADAVRFDQIDPDAWDTLFRVDVKGTMLMCAAAVPHMRDDGGGAIVNFSGSYGNGEPGEPGELRRRHTTARRRARVRALTAALARDLAPDIRVNAISPGPIAANWEDDWGIPAEHIDEALAMTPLGRMGQPEEIAEIVLLPRLRRRRVHHRPGARGDGGWIMDRAEEDARWNEPWSIGSRPRRPACRPTCPTAARRSPRARRPGASGSSAAARSTARRRASGPSASGARAPATEGIPCTCMNIGLATWADTREALENIYEDALSRGVRPPDRFNLIAERRMGLPKDMRADAPPETGPALWTEQDWWELTHTVPIQPEAADNMIGGPGSVDNALDALRVGITYIGVLSQYSWRWPYWDDEITQLQAVLTAAGVLAAFQDEGVVLRLLPRGRLPGGLPRLRQLRRLGDARALRLRGADRRGLLELLGRADPEPGHQVGGDPGAGSGQPERGADRVPPGRHDRQHRRLRLELWRCSSTTCCS